MLFYDDRNKNTSYFLAEGILPGRGYKEGSRGAGNVLADTYGGYTLKPYRKTSASRWVVESHEAIIHILMQRTSQISDQITDF